MYLARAAAGLPPEEEVVSSAPAPSLPVVPRGRAALGGTPVPQPAGASSSMARTLVEGPSRAEEDDDESPTEPRRSEDLAAALYGLRGQGAREGTGSAARSSPGPGRAAEPSAVNRLLRNPAARDKPRVRLVTPVISLDDGLLEELEVTDAEDPLEGSGSASLKLEDDDLVEVPRDEDD